MRAFIIGRDEEEIDIACVEAWRRQLNVGRALELGWKLSNVDKLTFKENSADGHGWPKSRLLRNEQKTAIVENRFLEVLIGEFLRPKEIYRRGLRRRCGTQVTQVGCKRWP